MGSCKAYLAQEAALAAGLAAGEASEVVADAGNVKSDSTAKRRSGLACISTGNDTLLHQWLTFKLLGGLHIMLEKHSLNFYFVALWLGKIPRRERYSTFGKGKMHFQPWDGTCSFQLDMIHLR